jgi:hypothetical protein
MATKRAITTDEIYELVDADGLGHCLQHEYTEDGITFQDEALQVLWIAARDSMFKLAEYLEATATYSKKNIDDEDDIDYSLDWPEDDDIDFDDPEDDDGN